ncbi:uncharacterized protein Gasu_21870 [Galdieria sulphuraria]|uniref:Uncharacterized protein n=1 Tax=Galdieria sulphuraria TaxID=130081 RepID=M2X2B2_GALSU|nr:uncharacterized protein Gasu_21870 [Galdieria sulphuraria]EME30515.1 hypothetical protein Gasu_21870 [Galdieria sulphuraria]|eukprot:XP_005707035.1 hypothetical protein Gasu_21870 [Galdieria sulphuraria]
MKWTIQNYVLMLRFPWSFFNVWGTCLSFTSCISGVASLLQWTSFRETCIAIYIIIFGCFWFLLELFPFPFAAFQWDVLYSWLGRGLIMILLGILQWTASSLSFVVGCLVFALGWSCVFISLLSLRYPNFCPDRMTTLFYSTLEEQPEYIPPPPSEFA